VLGAPGRSYFQRIVAYNLLHVSNVYSGAYSAVMRWQRLHIALAEEACVEVNLLFLAVNALFLPPAVHVCASLSLARGAPLAKPPQSNLQGRCLRRLSPDK